MYARRGLNHYFPLKLFKNSLCLCAPSTITIFSHEFQNHENDVKVIRFCYEISLEKVINIDRNELDEIK